MFLSWVAIWLWIPGWFAVTTLLPAMFPAMGGRRRLVERDARRVVAITITNAVLAWPLRGCIDRPEIADPDLAARFDLLNAVYLPEVAIVAALTVASVRLAGSSATAASSADVRRQIAWVMYGFAVAVVLSVVGANPDVGNWVQSLEAVALVGGLAIAMFRYNLYDIGLVVKRTLVYGALTATLAAAYLASVLLLQLVLSPTSDLAVAASTLTVAALFRPARSRIQTVVDRRFIAAYDAERTIDSFAARLRHEVTLDGLDAELRAVVREAGSPRRRGCGHDRRPSGAAADRPVRDTAARRSPTARRRARRPSSCAGSSTSWSSLGRETAARPISCSATGCWRCSARLTTPTARSARAPRCIADAPCPIGVGLNSGLVLAGTFGGGGYSGISASSAIPSTSRRACRTRPASWASRCC